MPTPPSCPDHRRLLLDLALGRLDDDAAESAEAARRHCPTCSAWWEDRFGTDHGIEAAVERGLRAFRPPRRWSWGHLAAAAVVVAGVGLAGVVGIVRNPASKLETAAGQTAVERANAASPAVGDRAIFADGFEDGESVFVSGPGDDEPIFASGFEDGIPAFAHASEDGDQKAPSKTTGGRWSVVGS